MTSASADFHGRAVREGQHDEAAPHARARQPTMPAPPRWLAGVEPAEQRRAEQRHHRHHQHHVAALHQREAVPLDQQRPEPQAAQRHEGRIGDARQRARCRACGAAGTARRSARRRHDRSTFARRAGVAGVVARQRHDRHQASAATARPAPEARAPRAWPATSQASGVPVTSMPDAADRPAPCPTPPRSAPAGKCRAMKTVHTRKAGAQPMPISTWPTTSTREAGRQRRQQRADDRQRKRRSTVRRTPVQVDADAHESCMRAEGEMEGAGEQRRVAARDRPKSCCSGVRHDGARRCGRPGSARRRRSGPAAWPRQKTA